MSASKTIDMSSARRARKSAFSCEPCRKRKVKCDGVAPACGRCRSRGVECVYGLPPTLEYTKRLERRLAELEAALLSSSTAVQHSDPIQGQQPSVHSAYHTPPGATHSDPQFSNRSTPAGHGLNLSSVVASPLSHAKPETHLSPRLDDLKVEENGRVSFHGPTSFFQLPRNRDDPDRRSPSIPETDTNGGRERLINDAWKARAFEQLANLPEPMKTLLNNHWTWIQPLFNFVYRPAFTRDMSSNGPYYSDGLLNAILAHSVRWCAADPHTQRLLDQYDGGKQFFRYAVSSVFRSVQQGNGTVPDVQALLLLSAQEAGRGNRTQAWLYSGMAIRLVEDMGINIDGRRFAMSAHFSSEDLEIRNRLFWSCYSWEKLLCLYFGRSPTIQQTPASPPQMLMDDSGEVEIWSPAGLGVTDYAGYPPHQAHSTSAFMSMCSLSEILNRVLQQLYNPTRKVNEDEASLYIREEASSLHSWMSALPPFLYIDTKTPPQYCPPSHIATLNFVFHIVTILLHRPMLYMRRSDRERPNAGTEHTAECMSSAISIVRLFELYRETFGDGHVVLIIGYSLYMAVSVFLLEAQASKEGSLAPSTLSHLHFCVQALERVKVSSPVINAALRLIYEEMNKLRLDFNIDPSIMGHTVPSTNMNPSNSPGGQSLPMPASGDWAAADIFVPDASLLPAQWGDYLDINPIHTGYMDAQGFAI